MALFKDDGKTLRTWDPDLSGGLSLDNWVRRVARWRAISLTRSKFYGSRGTASDEIPEMTSSEPGPMRRAMLKERWSMLTQRLRVECSEMGWLMFLLFWVQEMSVAEVCEATGKSHDAVYAWRSRLRDLVQRFLDDIDERAR